MKNKMLSTLSRKMYKAETRKNRTVVFAIAVSTLLVILVFSTFTSLNNMIEKKRQMMFGSIAEGVYLSVNGHFFEELEKSGKFEDLGLVCQMGTYCTDVDGKGLDEAKEQNKLLWASEKTAGWNFNELIEGSWAQEKDEIVVDENFVADQNREIKVGDCIHIQLRSPAQEYDMEAVIAGICRANTEWNESRVYVSDVLFDSDRSGYSMQAYCRFPQGQYDEEELIAILQAGDKNRVVFAAINPIATKKTGGSAVLAAVGIILLTAVCAGLMIYVIYYISFTKNVNQYGQLKLIGLSDKKIKRIVLGHAIRQYYIGVPTGCVIGTLLSYVIMPKVAHMWGLSGGTVITIRPIFFAYAAIIALVTVGFGISKPLRTLRKIEPVHTVGFVDSQSAKIKIKERNNFNEARFASRNIKKRKKSFLMVEFSVGVSVLLFVFTGNFVSSMSLDRLLDELNLVADIEIGAEEILGNIEYGEGADMVTESLPITLADDLAPLESKAKVLSHYQILVMSYWQGEDADRYCRLIRDSFEEEELTDSTVIDNVKAHQENGSPIWSTVYYKFYDIDQMNDFPIFEGEIDREKYESGNYVLATAIDEEGHSLYHVGDRVRIYEELPTVEGLVAAKGEGEQGVGNYYQSLPSREYEVMAVVGNRFEEEMYPREKLRTIDFLFPTEAMAKMSAEPELKLIAIDAYDLQQLNEIEEYVKEVLQHPGNEGKVEYRSVAEYNNSLNEFRLLFSLIGNGLALVIGMMALGNFINNCISGIVERKEEFRTLKAIGMPRNQLLRILRYENLFTVLTAVIPAYILGQVISKFLIVKIADRLGWLKWNRSWIPGIVLMIVLIGISLIYPNRKTDLEEQWVKD